MDRIRRRRQQPAPGPTRQDQLRLLQEHLASLRKETEGWLERQARVWQTAIAGIAAVSVLRQDTELAALVPLAPILLMAVLAQWLSLRLMVIRAGYSMTVDEHRINRLVGGPPLLSHEIELWKERAKHLRRLHGHIPLVILCIVIAIALHGGILLWFLQNLGDQSIQFKAAYGLAGLIVLGLAIANFVRQFGLPYDPGDPLREARGQERNSLRSRPELDPDRRLVSPDVTD